jgi:hypothetical protein
MDLRAGVSMRNAIIRAAMIVCCSAHIAHATTPKPGNTYLMSLTGLKVGRDEAIDQFKIDTWGVEVLSVCKIPYGWQISAGKSADPSGLLSGQASLGITFINQKLLPSLKDLFLVKIEGKLDRRTVKFSNGERPATFAGTAGVWTYGSDDDGDKKRLFTYRALKFRAARRCPP